MKTALSDLHRKRFEEIRRNLDTIGSSESSFIKIELLFFEAINIARDYGSDVYTNPLLADLKDLQASSYEKANEVHKKKSQREICIRKFIASFKRLISGSALALSA